MNTETPSIRSDAQLPPILSIDQAAAYLGTTYEFIAKMIRLGRLRATKLSHKLVRIRREDLEAFLESGATIGGGE
jgi:excisionase family DNA binding protein